MPFQNPFDSTEYDLIVRGPEGQNSMGKEQSTDQWGRNNQRNQTIEDMDRKRVDQM